jgi:hypothetical protein
MEERAEILLRGRLDGKQRLRLEKLLDMLYKPSELAEEIGFTRRQVYRVYMHFKCPHERDEKRRIWINGKAFREWYERTYPRISLADDEAFCLTCKRNVMMSNPVKKRKGRLVYWVCFCPKCGRKIGRIIDMKKRDS